MVLEFDAQCCTTQEEDSLQLYIPAQAQHDAANCVALDHKSETGSGLWWPVLRRFHGDSNWPSCAVVLPGSEVCFSLETASDYVKEVKDKKVTSFGFKCLVVGYEWPQVTSQGLLHLEKEMAYLGGMCAASLMKRDIILPPASIAEADEDFCALDDAAQKVFGEHAQLLSKGFALSQPLSIRQALKGSLPFVSASKEVLFLRQFVDCAPGSTGGRLAS